MATETEMDRGRGERIRIGGVGDAGGSETRPYWEGWRLSEEAAHAPRPGNADEKETAAGYQAEAAWREALVGNMSLAKQQAQAALALSTGRDVEAISAIALGVAGDVPQATRLNADLAKRFPEDTIV